MNLEQRMLENWKKVRKMFFYPDLPMPELVNEGDIRTAAIDMIDHKILVFSFQ